ncbi:helix-turn-helix transcriptional regulator [Catenuloplanes sp. NPDC051500]|uniref:helix-turn-helix transcriptional regulator n=1 Tax=Catenuloplanes sp. NPDC051500 TaxID=3363959 RepID=UPI00379FCB5A
MKTYGIKAGERMASDNFVRNELAAFLRSRRHRRSPEAAGLGGGAGRRTPGLRREEVARLAGVSLTWYTWLEQGRNIRVSRQVLSSIARALNLSEMERQHLFLLADEKAPHSPVQPSAPVSEDVRQFLALLDPYPSWVFDRYFNIVAWNRATAALLAPIEDMPPERRNALALLFLEPLARRMLPDWEHEAGRLVALLRTEWAGGKDDGYLSIVEDLRSGSPDFRALWDRRDVAPFTSSIRRFNHPRVGLLELKYLRLSMAADPGRAMMVHFLPPGDPGLPALLSLTGQTSVGPVAALLPEAK